MSGWLRRAETWVEEHFHRVLAAHSGQEPPPLVLDIGANAGYYSMLSMALGARVAIFDLQPSCWRLIEAAMTKNAFGRRGRLYKHGIATQPFKQLIPLSFANGVCDGHFGERGRKAVWSQELDPTDRSPHATGGRAFPAGSPPAPPYMARALPLSWITHGFLGRALASKPPSPAAELTLVKLDVEGAEIGILNASLISLMRERRIRHLLMEFNPAFWASSGTLGLGAQLIGEAVSCGYTLVSSPRLAPLLTPLPSHCHITVIRPGACRMLDAVIKSVATSACLRAEHSSTGAP